VNFGLILFSLVLLTLPSAAASAMDTSCLYVSEKDGERMFFDDCGHVDESGPVLTPAHRENIRFGEDDLACVAFSKDDAFWVHRNGKAVRTLFYDAWCGEFEGDLAIGKIDGREVYIDKNLDVVLDPGFESLSHFRYDFAVVCNGPFQYEEHGEHTFRKGGKCGLIDKAGTLVVDAIYPSEHRRTFTDYRNSHNECPPPPVLDEDSAVCHGKRHARNSDSHSGNWERYSLSSDGEQWTITFLETDGSGYEFTMEYGVDRADLRYIGEGEFVGVANDR